jgi:NADP-dependent 3-hydroxy acid dehydrogenase YdfG
LGAKVVICGRTAAKLDAARADQGSVFMKTCDIREPMQVEESVKAMLGEWGRIDIVVNNAEAVPAAGATDLAERLPR